MLRSSRRWGRKVIRTDYRLGTCGVLELDCVVEVSRGETEDRTEDRTTFVVGEEEIRSRETEIETWLNR